MSAASPSPVKPAARAAASALPSAASRRRAGSALRFVLTSALALLTVGPLLYLLAQIFMTPAEASMYPPRLLPSGLDTSSLRQAIETVPIFGFIANSFVLASAVTALQVLSAALAAYAFVYVRFAGSRFWFALFISTMMIPWEVTIIPNYLTVKSWGWLDTFPGLIVPFAASAFGVFLLRQFFLQLPRELFEAARIDGCGHVRHFLSVVLPLSGPAAASLGVYVFLNGWNMYLWPLLVTSSDAMRTVQIGIAMLQFEEMTSWNLVLCGVALVLVPSLVLLALGLRPLVRGITAGAVKG
ncbi:carbohydrate ABC transporter permease [Paenibacillus pasadenensis]|uniref:Glycerol-3-phosphate ABC transporter, permease protein UgpE n=1 Tax=Paenibacillus pasadenensis TaxID=217090 RepID=A0A2N5NBF6_9BACL|nr:carbohydrate ABC transporter permease [Paenibacillus pasadenensis]PLT47672.1 Glycerol-3-phosphate ABC transporter, permease protein UgpE [Paenibacillus pasadenensis]